MNILMVFCDMVRGNLLPHINNQIKKTEFDKILESLGGTFYTNAYTPAPDTGRGYAMLQTGLLPKKNGCDDVWKYPEFFLKENIPTIESILLKENFYTTYILAERNDISGVYPKNFKNRIPIDFNKKTYVDSFKELKKIINKNEKTFTWLSLDDYHVAADDYGASMKSDEVGKLKLASILKKLFLEIDSKEFDEIIFVSDHGNVHKHGFSDERLLNLLNDDRSKILLYRVNNKQNNFKINNELRSILDVFPTILEISKVKKEIECDGISLNKKVGGNRIITMESYSKFLHLSPLDLWACRSKSFYFLTNQNFKKMYKVKESIKYKQIDIDLEIEKRCINQLKKETVNYELKEKELLSIDRYYKVLNHNYKYSDNTERNVINTERLKSIQIKRIPYYLKVILSKISKRLKECNL